MDTENNTNDPLNVVKGREQEIGPLFGIFIILVLFIAGALYFLMHAWSGNQEKPANATSTEIIIYRHAPISTSTAAAASSTDNIGSDDPTTRIETHPQDASSTDR